MPLRRSRQVAAPLLVSAALALLAGCRDEEMKRCVDPHNNVVDESLCDAQARRPQASGAIMPYPYRWYYGGYGGYGFGSPAGGGAYAPVAGHSYASPTTRGGFGSTFGGGEGEGGHGGAGE